MKNSPFVNNAKIILGYTNVYPMYLVMPNYTKILFRDDA